MIDLSIEKPLSLKAAAQLVPAGRNGKRTHLSTLLRWILTGARSAAGGRVRLEAIRLGGRWLTSHAALQRFAEALTPRPEAAATTPSQTPGTRRRAAKRAAAELARFGI